MLGSGAGKIGMLYPTRGPAYAMVFKSGGRHLAGWKDLIWPSRIDTNLLRMKFFPLFNSAAMRARRHRRRKGPHVISAEMVLLIELFCSVLVLGFCLTGQRGA